MKEIPLPIEDRQMIFGILFAISNRLQKLMDRELAPYDITSRQWYLSLVLGLFFKESPTLNELADAMEYSHQNVRQIANKLEQKGFIRLEKDRKDQRAIRLSLTEKSNAFWQDRGDQADQFIKAIYRGISDEELALACQTLLRITDNLNHMENPKQKEDEQ